MAKRRKSAAEVLLVEWWEPVLGFLASLALISLDIAFEHMRLPQTGPEAFLDEALRSDALRIMLLITGPIMGFVVRHIRIQREKLYKDLVNTVIHILNHEIRNPLMVILGASSMMKQSDPEDAKRLRQIGHGVDRIVEAVQDLGAMAHITSQRFYDIRDRLVSSATPAKDLKRWQYPTEIHQARKPSDPDATGKSGKKT